MSSLRERLKSWANQPATSADLWAMAILVPAAIGAGLMAVLTWGSQ